MATVKMSSSRVIGTELVNEDNLKGYYMGDGATFFYRRGVEYLDVFPFWDWRKVPGVTAYEDRAPMPVMRSARQNNRSGNVGGLGDGRQGMTAMELDRDGLKGSRHGCLQRSSWSVSVRPSVRTLAVYQPLPVVMEGKEFRPSVPGVYYVELVDGAWCVRRSVAFQEACPSAGDEAGR